MSYQGKYSKGSAKQEFHIERYTSYPDRGISYAFVHFKGDYYEIHLGKGWTGGLKEGVNLYYEKEAHDKPADSGVRIRPIPDSDPLSQTLIATLKLTRSTTNPSNDYE